MVLKTVSVLKIELDVQIIGFILSVSIDTNF